MDNESVVPVINIDLTEITEYVKTISENVEHPFFTTPFEDYTVTEGLLLIIVLLLVISFCIKMLKGGFYWL